MTLCEGYILAGDKLTDVAKVLGRVTDTVEFDPAGIG